jgi:hypothetical protein
LLPRGPLLGYCNAMWFAYLMDTIWSSSNTLDICIYQTIPRHLSEDWSALNIKVGVSLNRSDHMVKIKTPQMPAETLWFHWCSSSNIVSSTTCIIQPVFRGAEWFLKIGCVLQNAARILLEFWTTYVEQTAVTRTAPSCSSQPM